LSDYDLFWPATPTPLKGRDVVALVTLIIATHTCDGRQSLLLPNGQQSLIGDALTPPIWHLTPNVFQAVRCVKRTLGPAMVKVIRSTTCPHRLMPRRHAAILLGMNKYPATQAARLNVILPSDKVGCICKFKLTIDRAARATASFIGRGPCLFLSIACWKR
jgi:hypothetical protein